VAWYVSPFGLFVLVAGLGIGAWKAGGVYQSLPTLCAGPSFSKHLGGKGVVVAAHRVVMDTLRFRLSCTRGSTLLVGTIPQAHLLLMSLMIKKGIKINKSLLHSLELKPVSPLTFVFFAMTFLLLSPEE